MPADAKVEWIFALKAGLGFDYAEFGQIDEAGRSQGGASAASLPGSVDLTLDGVRTARIKAVDSGGKPLSGVGFHIWLVHKEGRRSEVNVSSRRLTATTGPDGIATFDWLPPSKDVLQFWPVGEGYARRRVTIEDGQTGTSHRQGDPSRDDPRSRHVSRWLARAGHRGPRLRQRPGDRIMGRTSTRTGADGTYELTISPGEAYAVYVEDKDWAAPSRLDVVVREGKPAEGVDFKLTRGTIIHGRVTVGSGNRPAPNQLHLARRGRRPGT